MKRTSSEVRVARLVGRKGWCGGQAGEVPFVGAETCSNPRFCFFFHSSRSQFRVSSELGSAYPFLVSSSTTTRVKFVSGPSSVCNYVFS